MPQKNLNSDDQTPKRKFTELSPEKLTGINNMDAGDLIKLIKDTINSNLDEKLKSLPTKADLEEIKTEISSDLNALRNENTNLKQELEKVKQENENTKKDLIWLENQINTNKLFFRGLEATDSPKKEVINILRGKLEINPKINTARKVYEKDGKMSVIVEFESTHSIHDVFKNTKKLAGTTISIERDLMPTKQLKKKVCLLLKKKILAVSTDHKVTVREDKLKIKDRWFKWSNANKLVAGKDNGEDVLAKLYGEKIKSINLDFDSFLLEINSKN